MKIRQDAKILQRKSIASLKISMAAFNSFDDDGRTASVLLHAQHACEMLLKAVLVQNREIVFDKKSGRSLGFERCLRIGQEKFGLNADDALVMSAIDALRDSEQHWHIIVPEDLLYLQIQGLITAFDDFMKRRLSADLFSHIPPRVLPVATAPLRDFDYLIDQECKLIQSLLSPGRRLRHEARARIRALLALEAIAQDGVESSVRDVDRVERAFRRGEQATGAFPRLMSIGATQTGEGATLKVRFSKKEGAPVRYASGDDPDGAAALREFDLQKKFHLYPKRLADKLNLTTAKAKALRWKLGVDEDLDMSYIFEHGRSKFQCFSDNAFTAMRNALKEGNDIEQVVRKYKESKKKG